MAHIYSLSCFQIVLIDSNQYFQPVIHVNKLLKTFITIKAGNTYTQINNMIPVIKLHHSSKLNEYLL